ncbi:hypothetical protein D3C86_1280170 [compost metagenome]
MAAQILRVERMAHVTHRGLGLGARLQLDFLVHGEAWGRGVRGQPFGHGRHRRLVHVQARHRQRIDGLEQHAAHFVGLGRGGGIDGQPAIHGVDPDPGIAADAEGARQQFLGDLFLQFLELLAARLEALLLLQLGGARLGHLVDHGGRQQLLFGTEHQQHLLVDAVHKLAVVARGCPALGLRLQAGAREEGVFRQAGLYVFGAEGPRGGEAMNLEILKPHENSATRTERVEFYLVERAVPRNGGKWDGKRDVKWRGKKKARTARRSAPPRQCAPCCNLKYRA